jgi:phage gp36-like protein
MATYATKDDIDSLYGTQLLIKIADKDRNGTPDPEVVERGLRSADGIINGYLSSQYTLPLSGTSDLLIEIAVDVAIYKICLQRAILTTEMRTRYEDALALLDRISTGKIGIGPVTGDDGSGGTGTDPGAGGPRQAGRSIDTYRAS